MLILSIYIMKKKLLYISILDYTDPQNWGVARKIEGQKKAFENQSYEVHQLKILNKNVLFDDDHLLTLNGKLDFFVRLPFVLYKYFKRLSLKFDLIYFRKTYLTPLYYPWFNRLSSLSNVMLLEIPTYPYKIELQGKKLAKFLDDIANYLLKPKLYKIVTSQAFDNILGIKTIKIRNGYDFSSLKEFPRERTNGIRLISVANVSFWHALERVLHGMHNYKQKNQETAVPIYFHIVGQGNELPMLRQLKEDLQLEGVIFHGPKTGVELEQIYSEVDIGVGSLGLFRKSNVSQAPSSLKNMEFCFYGIPFIIGNPDEDLIHCKFVFEIPNDDSPLDIEKLIAWFNDLKITQQEIQKKGEELYSWDKQIRIIENDLKMNSTHNM